MILLSHSVNHLKLIIGQLDRSLGLESFKVFQSLVISDYYELLLHLQIRMTFQRPQIIGYWMKFACRSCLSLFLVEQTEKLASKVNRESYGNVYEGPFEIKRIITKNRFGIDKEGKSIVVMKANFFEINFVIK